ncbi:unnamed protein product [Heterobilharzia americana]|nr:unnamed protein product [Heterobilharzia americana]
MDLKIKAIEYFSSNNVLKELEKVLQSMFHENVLDYAGYLSNYFEHTSHIPRLIEIKADRDFSNIAKISRVLSVSVLWRTNTQVINRVNYAYGCSRCITSGVGVSTVSPLEFLACIHAVEERLRECHWSAAEMFGIDNYLREFYSEYRSQLQGQRNTESGTEINKFNPNEDASKSVSLQNAKKKTTKEIIPLIPNQLVALAPLLATDLTWLSISLHLTAAKCSRPVIDFQQYIKSLYKEVVTSSLTSTNKSNIPPVTTIGHNDLRMITCPIITILNCPGRIGGLQPGKCRFLQEILLIPKPYLKPKELSPQMICENGAASVNIDKPEQALDIILECLEQLQLKEEFYLGLYIAPKGIYDTVKERYEIFTHTFVNRPTESGRYRILGIIKNTHIISCDVMPNRSNSIASKSSATAPPTTMTTVATFDEPFKFSTPTGSTVYDLLNSKEKDNCKKTNLVEIEDGTIEPLQDAICQPIKTKTPIDKQSICYSSWLFTFDTCLDCVFITEVIQAVYTLHIQNRQVILSLDNLCVVEDWPVDMAIAIGINFIKFSGLNGTDKVDKLIAWYKYYQKLIDTNLQYENEWRLYNPYLFENPEKKRKEQWIEREREKDEAVIDWLCNRLFLH